MGFQDDWILRQIEMIVQFASRILFNKDSVSYNAEKEFDGDISSDNISNTDMLYFKLQRLIKDGKICEAENLLFDEIENSDKYIELAIDFYQTINQFTDEELQRQNFSRDEIYEGLTEIFRKLDIPIMDSP